MTAYDAKITVTVRPEFVDQSFLFTPSDKLPEGLHIESFVGNVNGIGIYRILIQNVSSQPVTLPRATKLGYLDFSCQVIGKVGITDDPVITTPNSDTTIQVETSELDENLRKQLLTLLNDFNHLFAGKNTEIRHTGLIKHTIDMQGHSPFRLRPNRSALKSRLLSRLPTCY